MSMEIKHLERCSIACPSTRVCSAGQRLGPAGEAAPGWPWAEHREQRGAGLDGHPHLRAVSGLGAAGGCRKSLCI